MQIHLSDALSKAEQTKNYTVPLEMEHVTYYSRPYPIVEKKPVELTIYHKGEKQLVFTFEVSLTAEIPCDRCVAQQLQVHQRGVRGC